MTSKCQVNGKFVASGQRVCMLDQDSGGHFWFYCNEGTLQKSDEPCNVAENENGAIEEIPEDHSRGRETGSYYGKHLLVAVPKKRQQ